MGLAEALGSLQPERRDTQTPRRLDVEKPIRLSAQTPKRSALPLQGTAKSKHPDFAKKTLYIRKATMRDAMRRYEDAGGVEESELIELLLQLYVSGRLDV